MLARAITGVPCARRIVYRDPVVAPMVFIPLRDAIRVFNFTNFFMTLVFAIN